MKKGNDTNTSQDFDRKHGREHVANHPRAAKDISNKEDKRKEARREHTNHFTNREGYPEKK